MGIIIKGDNNGIVVGGNLTIGKFGLVFGKGIQTMSEPIIEECQGSEEQPVSANSVDVPKSTTQDNLDRTKRESTRTSPTYALSEYGKQREAEAKECAVASYKKDWGISSKCAFIVKTLKLFGIIVREGVPAVRLLIHWGIIDPAETDIKKISDNWNDKLKKLNNNPNNSQIPAEEIDLYNEIIARFEEKFQREI